MHIAICGASRSEAAELCSWLRQIGDQCRTPHRCDRFDLAANLLYEIHDGRLYDVVLFDADSEAAAEAIPTIRQAGFCGKLILLSRSIRYAVLGYEWQVSGFLLKPFDFKQLAALIERLGGREDGVYYLQTRTGVIRLPYEEIVFVESCNSKCLLHSHSGRVYTVYAPLSKIEAALHDRRFLRCHQSYLINMDHVTAVDRQFSMVGGERALIRCKELRAIQHRYLSYIREKDIFR